VRSEESVEVGDFENKNGEKKAWLKTPRNASLKEGVQKRERHEILDLRYDCGAAAG
jgi:hypothetical protein